MNFYVGYTCMCSIFWGQNHLLPVYLDFYVPTVLPKYYLISVSIDVVRSNFPTYLCICMTKILFKMHVFSSNIEYFWCWFDWWIDPVYLARKWLFSKMVSNAQIDWITIYHLEKKNKDSFWSFLCVCKHISSIMQKISQISRRNSQKCIELGIYYCQR